MIHCVWSVVNGTSLFADRKTGSQTIRLFRRKINADVFIGREKRRKNVLFGNDAVREY